jgi:hypothetical protein
MLTPLIPAMGLAPSSRSKTIWITTATAAFALSLLSSNIAFSQEAAAEAPAVATESGQDATAESAAPASDVVESKTFVAAGESYQDSRLGISITPPSGWEVMTNTGTLSLVMREPKSPVVVYDKPTYQRNITVAAIHRSSPIDEVRAAELKEELVKAFAADTLVSDFQVLDHKFFNYRGVNDGLVVYSSLNLGDVPMMQMHVLVSGQEKQFLMTYTDMAEAFTDTKNPNFEQAWNSIVSIDVTGMAPERRDELIRYGVIAGCVFSFLAALMLVRRRARRKDFNAEADALEESSFDSGELTTGVMSTLHGGWRLNRENRGVNGDDMEFSQHGLALSHAPRTRQTEYVSTY